MYELVGHRPTGRVLTFARYASGGPLEEMPGGFDAWPPSPGMTAGTGEHVVIELPRRRATQGAE